MSHSDGDSGDLAGALDAYEMAPAIMLACEGDDMVLASANEAARDVFGDRCEFGRPVREIAPEVDAGTIELMDDMVGTVRATGRSITKPAHRVQVRAQGQAPFEVVWDLTFSPWFAADGSVRGVLAHGLDVTEVAHAGREHAGREPEGHPNELVALQDTLLPEFLPVLPGVEIAGRYLLAEDELAAGGDWYDAVGLADGRVALVVGDVATHGVAAATAMGRLRTVAQERLSSGADLDQVMGALDAFARRVPDARATTVCVLVLDPSTGSLQYCTAGHPPPLVVRLDGRSHYLRHTGAAPLATTGEMSVAWDRIEPGDLVLLYTDGILERPSRTPAGSTVELGQVAADAAIGPHPPRSPGPAEWVCQQALETMTQRSGYADDIALLVAQLTEPQAPLHLDLAADGTAVPLALEALATWLEAIRVRDLDHIVVQHAVDELVTNAVEHAYANSAAPGSLSVDAALLSSGELEVSVADRGVWLPARLGDERGRGLRMVRGMVDRLVVLGGAEGTVATVRHRLSRPAWMLTGASTPDARASTHAGEARTVAVDGAGLRVAGALDRRALDDLRLALDDVAQRGRVVVDLEGVTRLTSAAVEVLHVASRDAAERGQDLVFYAPAGTTAQHVLELVRLPYVLTEPVRNP